MGTGGDKVLWAGGHREVGDPQERVTILGGLRGQTVAIALVWTGLHWGAKG